MSPPADGAPAAQASDLRIEPVRTRRELDQFIRLPRRLYRGHKGFVAPLVLERRDALRQEKNPYFRHGEA